MLKICEHQVRVTASHGGTFTFGSWSRGHVYYSVSNMSPTSEKIRLPFKSAPSAASTDGRRSKQLRSAFKIPTRVFEVAKGMEGVAGWANTAAWDGKLNMEALLWQA